jgi:hypothetical protein
MCSRIKSTHRLYLIRPFIILDQIFILQFWIIFILTLFWELLKSVNNKTFEPKWNIYQILKPHQANNFNLHFMNSGIFTVVKWETNFETKRDLYCCRRRFIYFCNFIQELINKVIMYFYCPTVRIFEGGVTHCLNKQVARWKVQLNCWLCLPCGTIYMTELFVEGRNLLSSSHRRFRRKP